MDKRHAFLCLATEQMSRLQEQCLARSYSRVEESGEEQ